MSLRKWLEWLNHQYRCAEIFLDFPCAAHETVNEEGSSYSTDGEENREAVAVSNHAAAIKVREEQIVELWQEAWGRGSVFRRQRSVRKVE